MSEHREVYEDGWIHGWMKYMPADQPAHETEVKRKRKKKKKVYRGWGRRSADVKSIYDDECNQIR